jgi:hypothetical protein
MSRKRKIWVVVSLAVALLLLIPLGLRWQAQWHLSAYRKKLIAAGEKLTVEELAPKGNPLATNTALLLKLAAPMSAFGNFAPQAMHSIKPGVARVAWRQPQLTDKSDGNGTGIDSWPPLADAVKQNEQTFSELQSLLNSGGIDWVVDYSQPTAFNGLPYLSDMKVLAIAFNARAMLALHEGRIQEALTNLAACGSVSQLTARSPIVIDQLVRYACMSIETAGCWEALQAVGWTDDQLAQLQRQWEGSDILAAAEASLSMERAQGPILFRLARSSRQGMADTFGGNLGIRGNAEIWHDFLLNAGTGLRELLASYPRYYGWRWIWSYQNEQRYLEFMQTMIEVTRGAQNRQGILLLLPAVRITVNAAQQPEGTASLDVMEPMKDSVKRFVLRVMREQTVDGIVRTAIALERFRLARHAYPVSLRDLVPDFLHEVPVDCMDGHDLRYRLNPDGAYLLYSVGEDGVDNGGDPTPVEGRNLGFLHGRDWVWPRGATDEEVQAYEAEQNKPKPGSKR